MQETWARSLLGRSPGGVNGHPLQYSCLENPMEREAWWATVHGVEKRDTSEWLTHQKSRRNGGWSIIHRPQPAKLHVTPVPRKRSIWNPVVQHCLWIWICEFSSSLERVCNHPDQHPGAFRSFIDMCGASLCCRTSRTPTGVDRNHALTSWFSSHTGNKCLPSSLLSTTKLLCFCWWLHVYFIFY